jgi:hypothetical protein
MAPLFSKPAYKFQWLDNAGLAGKDKTCLYGRSEGPLADLKGRRKIAAFDMVWPFSIRPQSTDCQCRTEFVFDLEELVS